MTHRNQWLCAWSGPAFMLSFSVALMVLARFIPPPSPSLSAVEVAEIYRRNQDMIRAAIALILTSVGFIGPFIAVISNQMRRIEGDSRALTYTQLISGGAALMLFVLVAVFWGTAAFRPERSAELVLLLNDLGWILLLTPTGPFIVQNLSIALAILQDRRPRPIFPRWVAFLNIWVAVGFVPAVLAFFFKHGPFAWDGIFIFWVPLVLFGAWIFAMFGVLLQAIGHQAAEAAP